MGPTGAYARSLSGDTFMTVMEVPENTPAFGILQFGDTVHSANGVQLSTGLWDATTPKMDIRIPLGNAITEAEATDGKLTLGIQREGEHLEVVINLPVLGAYSASWPLDDTKSDIIVNAYADSLIEYIQGTKNGLGGFRGSTGIAFLLSTGQEEHLDAVRDIIQNYMGKWNGTSVGTNNWNNGWEMIALGEYYLRTGDAIVLPKLKAFVDDAFDRDANGGWGHWDYPSPGYVGSGLVNAAGGSVFVGIVLARECGVEMEDEDFEKTLRYFYRFAGYGGPEYGDHRPNPGGANNGKTGMVGVGLSLLNKPYSNAAPLIGLQSAWSVAGFEGGHTGNWTNVLWRALSSAHVPAERSDYYFNYLNKMRWYLELARRPDGSFEMLPGQLNTKFKGQYWGGAVALNYTAGRKNLRITGAPPTAHSVIKHQAEVYPKNEDFFKTTHAEGYTDDDFESEWPAIGRVIPYSPYNVWYSSRGPIASLEYLEKHLRHFDPLIRSQAAYSVGYHGDKAVPMLIEAIQSDDARVRQAGLMAIAGTSGFHMDDSSQFKYKAEGKTTLAPYVISVLENPNSDQWELDAALFAMVVMPQEIIIENLDLLETFLTHESWWVRVAAFKAIGEAEGAASSIFDSLIECFVREQHGVPRAEYSSAMYHIIYDSEFDISEESRSRAIEALGADFQGGVYPRDRAYSKSGAFFYEKFSSRVLGMFPADELLTISDELNLAFANMGHPVLSKGKSADNLNQSLEYLIWDIEAISTDKVGPLVPGLKALNAGGIEVMTRKTNDIDYTTRSAASVVSQYESLIGETVAATQARKIDYSTPEILNTIPTPDDLRVMMHHPLNEGSGDKAENHAMFGSKADVTLENNAAWTNQGLAPISTSSLNAQAGYASSNHGSDSRVGRNVFTLSSWIRLPSSLSNTDAHYVAYSTVGKEGWNLGVRRMQVDGLWKNVPFFSPKYGGDELLTLNDSLSRPDVFLEADKNYFIAHIRNITEYGDEDPENSQLVIYDPETDAWLTNNGDIAHTNGKFSSGNTHIGIGAVDTDSVEETTRFPGLVDDPQLWNVPLTAAELFLIANRSRMTELSDTPEIATLPATTVGSTTTDLNALVTPITDGNPNVIFYYGTVDGGKTASAWQHAIDLGQTSGSVQTTAINLSGETTYYYRAFASSSAGDSWSDAVHSFTTLVVPDPPQVDSAPATGVGHNFATFNASIVANGGENPSSKFYYGTTDEGTNPDQWENVIDLGLQSGSISEGVQGLTGNTTYYYRLQASNPGGEDWSAPISFTTFDPLIGGTINSSADDGYWMSPDSWDGVLAPSPGDVNTWYLRHSLIGQNLVDTFEGGTLRIGEGGGLRRTLNDNVESWKIDNLIVEAGGRTLHGSANRSNHFKGTNLFLEDGAILTSYRTTSYGYDYWMGDEDATVHLELGGFMSFTNGPSGSSDLQAFRGTFDVYASAHTGPEFQINFSIPPEKATFELKLWSRPPEEGKTFKKSVVYNLRSGIHHAFTGFSIRLYSLTNDDGDNKHEPELGETYTSQDFVLPVGTYNYTDLLEIDEALAAVFNDDGERKGTITVIDTTPPSLPTVETRTTNINHFNSLELKGEVTSTGGDAPTVHIYYGTTDGGTNTASWDASVEIGPRSGEFSQVATGLTMDTRYYYRAYATNSAGSAWASSTEHVDTYGLPAVQNEPATNIDFDLGTLHGSVTKLGGDTPNLKLYWGRYDGGTDPDAWTGSINQGKKDASFSQKLTSLTPGTTYYYRAHVENIAGGAWAPSTASFTTLRAPDPAVVSITGHSTPTDRDAIVYWNIDDVKGDPPTVWIYYGTSDAGENLDAWEFSLEAVSNGAAQSYETKLPYLPRGATIYYKLYSENAAGGSWSSSTGSFTTLETPHEGLIPIDNYMDDIKVKSDSTYYADLDTGVWGANNHNAWYAHKTKETLQARNLGRNHRTGLFFSVDELRGQGWQLAFHANLSDEKFSLNLYLGKDDGNNAPEDLVLTNASSIAPENDIVEGEWHQALSINGNTMANRINGQGFYYFDLPADINLSHYDVAVIQLLSSNVSGYLDNFGFIRAYDPDDPALSIKSIDLQSGTAVLSTLLEPSTSYVIKCNSDLKAASSQNATITRVFTGEDKNDGFTTNSYGYAEFECTFQPNDKIFFFVEPQ
ncbi:DUF6288 domain-containing protein [Pelagicoccus mobilis]|uniref:Fibronectin type-III domain-containing protein n=1 Tax=Pelagicoccus mobilis TaxID=415221 RepID=A0A934VNQ2_9BACT|nr:DUF6288 domain-containing protein [Pelagicoccus mobilis]MBK1876472.1 hypothetical protein [Pelagicoccus mobilis]